MRLLPHINGRALVAACARLLPALMPSWRFFDSVGPSPRLDYAWVDDDGDAVTWHAFRPRPARLPFTRMLARLVWNPRGNETLFVTRVAERLLEGDDGFPLRELPWRLALACRRGELGVGTRLRYRVRVVARHEGRLVDEIAYVSPPFDVTTLRRAGHPP